MARHEVRGIQQARDAKPAPESAGFAESQGANATAPPASTTAEAMPSSSMRLRRWCIDEVLYCSKGPSVPVQLAAMDCEKIGPHLNARVYTATTISSPDWGP